MICHRFTGAAVVVMAFVNVFLGFKQVTGRGGGNAGAPTVTRSPHPWRRRLDLHFGYYVAYALWIALFAVAAVVLELSCRRRSSPADLSKPPPSEDPSPALPTAPPSFNGANPMISKPYDASYA